MSRIGFKYISNNIHSMVQTCPDYHNCDNLELARSLISNNIQKEKSKFGETMGKLVKSGVFSCFEKFRRARSGKLSENHVKRRFGTKTTKLGQCIDTQFLVFW